jgi:hypothetical protein
MTCERVLTLTRANTPQAYSSIFTGADSDIAIRAEGYRPDSVSMTLQRLETLTRFEIPQPDVSVIATAG